MNTEEAIKLLRRMQEPEAWEPQITGDAYDALEMAITALQAQDIDEKIGYMERLNGGADYFNAFRAISEKVKNTNTFHNNSNDEVNNSNSTQSNGIESKVKGLTACRVPEVAKDTNVHSTEFIIRQAAIDIFDDYNVSVENGELEAYSRDRKRLCDLPSVQPDWDEMIVICDCCGHAIKVERRTDD